jgi:hypothetical protein
MIGVAWATSLRAWMTHLTLQFGGSPDYTWDGTFLAVLLPALVVDDFIGSLLDGGKGFGAIGVVLIGLCGGFAISSRGLLWSRVLAGLAAAGVTGVMVSIFYLQHEWLTASEMFGGLHLVVLMSWLAVGCSVPRRRPATGVAA